MNAVARYVHETWPEASATVEDTLRKTYEAVVDGMIRGRPTWLSRQIDDWSQHTFPPATAKVVAAAIVALPLVALYFSAPPPITLLLKLVLFFGRSREESPSNAVDRHDFLNRTALINSISLENVVYGTIGIVAGILSKNSPILFIATCDMVIGCTALYFSHFLQDTVEAGKELYEGRFRGINTSPTM